MKMVLIPESEYRRLKPQGEVNKILSGKRDRKAATEMSQMFGRYLRTKKPEQLPRPSDKIELLGHLPVIYHGKVSNF